ncbi:hypothetical protein F511_30400 [Dorcoceras hygrometricum]|uniref:Uncharacterized protein n=1 Tax=Dorcoceras hygrometricum TaxID=472368 RepID=A0A2Z7AA39_9LAMI|nr:hypothetical protein F511_30400 [Dorcoceras hygrometricum]
MGCPGQARTKPRRKLAVASLLEDRRTAAARRRPPPHIARGTRPRAAMTRAAQMRDAPNNWRILLRDTSSSVRPLLGRGATFCAATMRPAANLRSPTSAQRLAQDSRPSHGHKARHRAAACSQLRAGVAAAHGGGRWPSPRPEGRLLRQPALEGLTLSTRTDSPRKTDRSKSDQLAATATAEAGGGGGFWERRGAAKEVVHPKSSSYAQHIELSIRVGISNPVLVRPSMRLATSPHDPLGITDSACKNQLVMVSVQYDPFNPYIPIRSTTIGKSRVAIDPIAMHTSWRSNSDIASVTSAKAKRCRINLSKRHRFAIANSKYHLLVNSSVRLDFFLYDVASSLASGSSIDCALAELSSSVDCDDITAVVIIADSRSCTSSQLLIVMTSSLLLIDSSRMYADIITADVITADPALALLYSSADCDDVILAAQCFLQNIC